MGVGLFVGPGVGAGVGAGVGSGLGTGEGSEVGSKVGSGVGCEVGTGLGAGVGSSVGNCVGKRVGNSVSAIISIFTASIMAVRSPLLPECINFRVASPAAILNMVEKYTNEYDNVPELIVAEAMAPPEAVTLAVSYAAL